MLDRRFYQKIIPSSKDRYNFVIRYLPILITLLKINIIKNIYNIFFTVFYCFFYNSPIINLQQLKYYKLIIIFPAV